MPLEVVYGESRNRAAAQALAAQLREVVTEGTVYLAYPVLATADERVEVDALLVTREHGLVAFLLADYSPAESDGWGDIVAEQDRLFAVLEAHLSRYERLRSGRRLAIEPHTATIFPAQVAEPSPSAEGFYGALEEVAAFVADLPPIGEDFERALQAALQRVSTIKPFKKRANVTGAASRGAVLREIESGIANLDRWQKAAAIESPEGPQRIRGLAGSGKTIVLALKAAYLHTQHPDWQIALTFHSRALYQQMLDLTTRFTFEHSNDRPDPEHLRIVHSWGSFSRPGVYSMIAAALGETPRDFSYARGKYGIDGAFQGVCQELLEIARTRSVSPIFDAVLIDEAQDLPTEFFRLVYLFTREPKRVIWAYDEMQKLSESAMPDTDELFGTGSQGDSLVSLESGPDSPRRDIVLPICYRNTPWALATAHALGIGVYRAGGLLQHPDEPGLWREIGYEVVHGRLQTGRRVTLARRTDSAPEYFSRLIAPEDAVAIATFNDEQEQDAWVAAEIVRNLGSDELDPDDILIVLPDTYRAKSRAPRLMRELGRLNVVSHLVGVTSSTDSVFRTGSIAIAHIYRAKGNEAPMVYALDSQYAAPDFNAVSRRNTLFTAVTRSRAWVRIAGWGPSMAPVAVEARTVVEKMFRLEFKVPTSSELAALRHIYRVRAVEDEESVRRATEGLSVFLEAIDRGEMDFQDLPPAMRTRLVRLQQEGFRDDS
jgi:superfamily I DNA and RNA helicase